MIADDEMGWSGAKGEPTETEFDAVRQTGPLSIRLKIGNNQREVEVNLTKPVYLGRLDPTSDVFPDVNLTPDGGLEQGVSRRHARILTRDGSLVIEDLGSINGTLVNGKRLVPYLPEPLHHGDQLQIGKLMMVVQFR
jgi:pSer/pThr/pTyr-binding forkhead associated (FHA) protein